MTATTLSRAIDLLLYASAVIGAGWMLIPGIMKTLNLFWLRSAVREDPNLTRPQRDDSYRQRFEQILALGFRPLGVTHETAWFLTPYNWRWQAVHAEPCFSAPDGRVLMTCHRIVPDEPVRFSAVSLLERGGVVRTSCPGVGFSGDVSPRHRRLEIKGVEPAELLDRHAENVARFCHERQVAARPATLSDFAVESDIESRLTLARQGTRSYWALLRALSFIPALAFLLLSISGRTGLRLNDLAFSVLAMVGSFAIVRNHIRGPGLRDVVLASHARTERR
jgi:hypothetical protein